MKPLHACCRCLLALVSWWMAWCLSGVALVQTGRTALDIGLTLDNQQPGAVLAGLDWGWSSRLVDAAMDERQQAVDSCGPAALRRVLRCSLRDARLLGAIGGAHEPTSDCVERWLRTHGEGCTLGALRRAAMQLGLTARLLVAGDPREITPPAILHLRRGHFVVLEACTEARVHVFDPAHGVLHTPLRSLTKRWSGAVLQFAEPVQRPFPVAAGRR